VAGRSTAESTSRRKARLVPCNRNLHPSFSSITAADGSQIVEIRHVSYEVIETGVPE
jgi:hypothetical protein